jgi:uncharacterized protein YjeT (DUF2065 family)
VRAGIRLLTRALLVLLAVELATVVLAPLLIPDATYLRLYLGRRARESTARLLADRGEMLVYDAAAGWRNRPDFSRERWTTDSLGSRSSHAVARARSTPLRLLLVGNSLVNGGTDVAASETIAALLEDTVVEAVNFGTMMYSLDQMYQAYRSDLYRLEANVVVVGLSEDPGEGLTNRYLPFRYHSEANIPFLKPRFVMTDTGLALLPVPPRDVYARLIESGDILDSLRGTDAYYDRFIRFRRFGLTPVATGVWRLYEHARNLRRLLAEADSTLPLSVALMRRFADEARGHGAQVVFVILPRAPLVFPPLWRRWLPDHYAHAVAELRRHGFTLLDGRDVLRQARRSTSELYTGEDYTPTGNRLIADALRRLLGASIAGGEFPG